MRQGWVFFIFWLTMLGVMLGILLGSLLVGSYTPPPTHIYTPQQLCQHNGGVWQVASNTCKTDKGRRS